MLSLIVIYAHFPILDQTVSYPSCTEFFHSRFNYYYFFNYYPPQKKKVIMPYNMDALLDDLLEILQYGPTQFVLYCLASLFIVWLRAIHVDNFLLCCLRAILYLGSTEPRRNNNIPLATLTANTSPSSYASSIGHSALKNEEIHTSSRTLADHPDQPRGVIANSSSTSVPY